MIVTRSIMAGPGSELIAHYRLIARLLAGDVLDRQAIAKELGVQEAAADRQIRAMVDAIPQLITARDRSRHRTIRLPPENVQREPSKTMAVAASLGAALSNLFRGSAYERNLRAALEHVLERIKNRAEFKDADRKFYFVAQGGETALPDNEGELDEIVDAILKSHVLKFDYVHFAGKAKCRTVEPLTLAIYQHQLYVLAREDARITVIRFSRIKNANATRKRFTYPARLEYDPHRLFRNILGIFAKDDPALPVADVELRLGKEWRTYAATHRWHESQRTVVDGTGVRLSLHVAMCPELEQLILSFGEHCEVLQPRELRDRIAARVAEMARSYSRRSS